MARLHGRKQISAALGLKDECYVTRLASLDVDPLPAWSFGGRLMAESSDLSDWDERRRDLRRIRRSGGGPRLPVVVGRTAIAKRAGVSTREIDRWAGSKIDPLPLLGRNNRRERLSGGADWIYDTALRDWLRRRVRPYLGKEEGKSKI